MLKVKQKNFALLQKISDLTVVTIAWWIAYYVRFEVMDGGQYGLESLFLKLNIILLAIYFFSFEKSGLYSSYRFSSRYKEILAVIKANSVGLVYLVLFIYFFGGDRVSRLTITLYFVTSSLLLLSLRIGMRNLLRHYRGKGHNLRYVALIGNNPLLQKYIENIYTFKDCGIKVLRWTESGGLDEKFNISNNLKDKADFYVVSYAWKQKDKEQDFLSKHYNDVTPIQLLPDLSYSLVGHEIDDFGGIPLATVNQPVFPILELFLKRLIDTLVVGVGLVLISPLMVFLVLGVRLSSPGPIFYSQERVGKDGKRFKMWKFRSMRPALNDEDQTSWESKGNPRVTKFGLFIRKTSLDELPQLWNVLIGNMSLVGPRPERTHFVEKFRHEIPHYMLRHKMKSGITGWAQVNGLRGDTDLTERIEYDIYYIKNWSIFLDIKIIFLTFLKGFIDKNAY